MEARPPPEDAIATERQQRRALSAAAFTVGYLAAWFGTTVLPAKVVWYLPLERRFTYEVHPLGVGADFYGRLLWAAFAGIGAAAIALLWGRRRSSAGLAPALRVLWVWCLSLLLLNIGLYGFTLMHREPVPLPLPDHDGSR